MFLVFPLTAIDDSDKYYHEHDGVGHDLSLARITFDSILIIDPVSQLHGEWVLKGFQTTDTEMMRLVQGGEFIIHLDVAESYLQTTVKLRLTGKNYQDPPIPYHIDDGHIHIENNDFDLGVTENEIILTMIAMDEAYRYTFIRRMN